MTINISTPADMPSEPLTNKAFNTDIAGVREEVRRALVAAASGVEYDATRKRPYKITKPDGTVVEYR